MTGSVGRKGSQRFDVQGSMRGSQATPPIRPLRKLRSAFLVGLTSALALAGSTLGQTVFSPDLVLCPGTYFDPDPGSFSHYLNGDHIGSPVPGPDYVRNYGQPAADSYPLTCWEAQFPEPPLVLACSTPHEFQVILYQEIVNQMKDPGDMLSRRWLGRLLPYQGAMPENSLSSPWTVPDLSGGPAHEYRVHYRVLNSGAKVLIFAPGTGTGSNFQLDNNSTCAPFHQDVLYWIPGTHGDPYEEPLDPWYEIETVENESAITGPVGVNTLWFREGSIPHEAFQRGMTVVMPYWSALKRPVLFSLVDLIEIDRYLKSPIYTRQYTNQLLPGADPRDWHRNFISGVSYGGGISMLACRYLDWMFHGGVGTRYSVDTRQLMAWSEGYDFQRGQLTANYNSNESTLLRDPYQLMILNELEAGTWGPPVDLTGISLLASDLDFSNLGPLQVPFISVLGDQDSLTYSFFDQGLSGLASQIKVPLLSHYDLGTWLDWNTSNQVLGQLLGDPATCNGHRPCPPDIDWSIMGNVPARSEEFLRHDEGGILRVPQEQLDNPDPTIQVTRVTAGAWPTREVSEGLGGNDSIVITDLDGTAQPEIVAPTARGDVVAVTWNGATFEVIWREPVSIDGTYDFLGFSEVLWDDEQSSILALHEMGAFVEFDTVGNVKSRRALPGRGYHSFREREAGKYVAVDDRGRVIEINRAGALWNITAPVQIEGYATFFEPITPNLAVYGSPHGNVKYYDFNQPGQPTSLNMIGEYLEGFPSYLVELDPSSAPSQALYLLLSKGTLSRYSSWRITLLNANLNETRFTWTSSLGSPPRTVHVASSSTPQEVDMVSTWDVLPVDTTIERPGLYIVSIPVPQSPAAMPPGHPPTPNYTLAEYARLLKIESEDGVWDMPNGAFQPIPAEDITTEVDNDARSAGTNAAWVPFSAKVGAVRELPEPTQFGAFNAHWVATLHSGEIVLLGDLTGGDLSRVSHGVPLGSAFGLTSIKDDDDNILVVGTQKNAWVLNATNGGLFNFDQVTGAELANPDRGERAHFGASALVSPFDATVTAVGMYDSGEVWENAVGAQTALLAYPCTEIEVDRADDWAGIKVTTIDRVTGAWDYDDPNPLFQSDLLSSPSSTARPEPDTSLDQGNSIRWADLDGDGLRDIVTGTHGGRLIWFRNTSGTSTTFNSDPAGTSQSADLGSRIIGLEVADIDGTGGPETVFVAPEVDEDATDPTQLASDHRGTLRAFRVRGGALIDVTVGPLIESFGIYGLKYLSNPFGDVPARDYLAVTTASGRLYLCEVLEVPNPPNVDIRLVPVFETDFHAPLLGAYNSIEVKDVFGTTRLIMASSGGVFAFDLTRLVDPLATRPESGPKIPGRAR